MPPSQTLQIEKVEKIIQAVTVALLLFCIFFLTRALNQLDVISIQVAHNTTSIAVLTERVETLRKSGTEKP